MLSHGLNEARLRKWAAAASTSDRMLLHYFLNKEELLTASLTCITERMIELLARARSEQMPFQPLLFHLAGMMRIPAIRPYMRLYLQLVALSTGKDECYRRAAQKICELFQGWIASALKVEREEDRLPMAALALATMEGFVLLDALEGSEQIALALAALAGKKEPDAIKWTDGAVI